MKLSDLLAQIGNAGAVAAQQASEYSKNRLLNHFEIKGGYFVPKTVDVEIAGERKKIPTFVLSRSGGLDLDELHVELETDLTISRCDEKKHDHTPDCKIEVGLKRGLMGRYTHAKVKATFKMGNPPEALSQVEDRLNQELREVLSG